MGMAAPVKNEGIPVSQAKHGLLAEKQPSERFTTVSLIPVCDGGHDFG